MKLLYAPNAASLGFAEHQGSFLVGVAAALKSETNGKLGFVGGIDSPLIQKFEAGFVAGAKSVNPEIFWSMYNMQNILVMRQKGN